MGRIRSIKPEFPQSESMGRVSREARLLFIQLWTLCDDEGRARASSRLIASLLYPYDADSPKLVPKWLDELERESCIVRYQVNGDQYLEICNWLKHQKIDRPSKSKFPSIDEGSRVVIEASRLFGVGSRIKDQGRDQGSMEQGGGSGGGESAPPAPVESDDSTKISKSEMDWRIRETWTLHLEAWKRFFLDVNGTVPINPPSFTDEIRDSIRQALLTHDKHLLTADLRERWTKESKARAAGCGIFLDPWCTGEHKDNDVKSGGKRYIEHWRPWKRQRGKGDPVDKFAELYYEAKSVTRVR